MRFPWKRIADAKALTMEAQESASHACEQVEQAKAQYEATLRTGSVVREALAALFYHAEKNHIIESMQKVVRGQS